MAYTHDLNCLYSTVKNISGGSLKFGFLPPHGRELANAAEFTVFGNILDAVANGGADRSARRRSVLAFESALDTGKLEVVHTPSPILKDTNDGRNYMLVVTSGTLAVDDPCWESFA